MKNKICLLCLLTVLFTTSCTKLNTKDQNYEDLICDIAEVDLFIVEDGWYHEGDVPEELSRYRNLLTEQELRTESEINITLQNSSAQIYRLMTLLYSAKPVSVKNNKVITGKMDGLDVYWQSGMVIDVYYDKREMETYIMQNGAKVFYKKGEEGKFYKMPKLILKKYHLTESEVPIPIFDE